VTAFGCRPACLAGAAPLPRRLRRASHCELAFAGVPIRAMLGDQQAQPWVKLLQPVKPNGTYGTGAFLVITPAAASVRPATEALLSHSGWCGCPDGSAPTAWRAAIGDQLRCSMPDRHQCCVHGCGA